MKRNRIKIIGAAGILVFSVIACTEKMDVPLNTSAPQLVIEGIITDEPYCVVMISKSSSLDSAFSIPNGVSGALVIVSDNAGNQDTAQEVRKGMYRCFKIAGVPGKTYSLQVIVGGITYRATSTMPQKVMIDSVKIEESTGSFINPDIKRLRGICYFKDPAGVRNFYKIESIQNNMYQFSVSVASDRLWDGKLRNLLVPSDTLLKGDVLTARLLSIDQNVYEYFRVLRDLNSVFNRPAAPANPPSNISPPTLGYFSAHAVSEKSVVVE
jgi:hypothetical protein